jgi:diguanylate cyclase (GGDEF)-like protein/PAS domain S-box-containing protein
VVGLDTHLTIRSFNEGAEFILGFPGTEVAGCPVLVLVAERFRSSLKEELAGLTVAGGEKASKSRRLHLCMLRQDGREVPVDATFSRMDGEGDGWLTMVLRSLDPEERRERTDGSEGCPDPLTALPDRSLFVDLADQSLNRLGHHRRNAGVLVLDLNRFRWITNTLGREGGDELLAQVGKRLRQQVRPGDLVGRHGGDQFAVFLNDLAAVEDLTPLVMRLLAVFEDPFRVHGHEIMVSARAGISVFPGDGKAAEGLLRGADMARSRAERMVTNNWAFYTPELERSARQRLELESCLQRALEKDEFRLAYQPIIELASGRLTAVEALLRWDRPEVGPVSPGEFISLLEETGMIVPVGEWVVRTAARQLVEWRKQGLHQIELSVNLSPRQLADPDLEHMLEDVLQETGLPPGDLRLEITESLFLRDLPGAEAILRSLRKRGFGLSLDDFGTGYSALGYLRQLPFDRLKLDRTFVQDIPRTMEGTALVRGILHLADTLGISTVAEGVERKEQADALRWLGCPEAQGFGFSPPVSSEAIAELGGSEGNWPVIPATKGGRE